MYFSYFLYYSRLNLQKIALQIKKLTKQCRDLVHGSLLKDALRNDQFLHLRRFVLCCQT